MVAVEDVADAGGVDITLDHKTRCQVKADGASEYRRVPCSESAWPGEVPPICRRPGPGSWAQTGAANQPTTSAKRKPLAIIENTISRNTRTKQQ